MVSSQHFPSEQRAREVEAQARATYTDAPAGWRYAIECRPWSTERIGTRGNLNPGGEWWSVSVSLHRVFAGVSA